MATTTGSSTLALSGLASGIDWQSLITQLASAERAPETQMNADISTYKQQSSAYSTIGTDLVTLATDITTLTGQSLYDSRTTTVSDPTIASATADDSTATGSYTFDFTQIATAASQQGTTAAGKALSATNDVSGLVLAQAGFTTPISAGTFSVNGNAVTIATTDTLQSVFDKISAATGGAVTGSYNASTDEISLNSSSPITLGSATDTSNFLQSAKLFNNGTGTITSTSALGGVSLTNALSAANLATTISDGGSGSGAFKINGVTINFNATNDNMNDVLSRINDSAAGVTATYDAVNNRFTLTDKTTGDVGISLQDVTGNFLAATGLTGGTLQRGSNAQYTINGGGTLTSESNIITSDSSGLTGLSVTALTTGQTTVTVGSDTSKISTAINQFVTDYNAVQSYISSQTASTTDSSDNVTAGTLTGDTEAEGIASTLRQLVDASPADLTGTAVSSLNDLGIVSNGNDNTLAVSDTNALNSALTNNLDAVKSLFTDATSGLGTTLKTYVTSLTSNNGLLQTKENDLSTQESQITTSIAALETKVTNDQNQWTAEFTAMETAVESSSEQRQYLTSEFSGGSSSTPASGSASSSASGL